MKCTHCGLINPESALRCDCGYDFATQTIKSSYLPAQPKSSWERWGFLLTSPAIFIVLGPPVGYFSSLFIPFIKSVKINGFTANDWRLLIAWFPAAYAFGGIPALSTGILYGFISLILPHKILRNFLCRALLGGAIGMVSTRVFCQFSDLNTDLVFWAGLPAGAICGLLPQNCPSKSLLQLIAEKRVG
mgnify:CR=1 FL=1